MTHEITDEHITNGLSAFPTPVGLLQDGVGNVLGAVNSIEIGLEQVATGANEAWGNLSKAEKAITLVAAAALIYSIAKS